MMQTINELSGIHENLLFKRLHEIDDELKDFHISAYKCDLLYDEQTRIKLELQRRGYSA